MHNRIIALFLIMVVSLTILSVIYTFVSVSYSAYHSQKTARIVKVSPTPVTAEQTTQTFLAGLANQDTYEGTLPCADCEGLQTVLTLNSDQPDQVGGSFTLTQTYVGRAVKPLVTQGTWSIQQKVSAAGAPQVMIVLKPTDNANPEYYLLEDADTLTQLDEDGHPIEAPGMNFTLKRVVKN